MNLRKEAARTTVIWGVLIACLLFTKPATMPVYFLFVPFILLGLAVYSLWKLLVLLISSRARGGGISNKQRAAGTTISIGVVVLLGMQSLGELMVRDFITVVLFGLVFYFYLARNLLKD